jgi:hypothetical protein
VNQFDPTSAVRFVREFVRDKTCEAFNLLSVFQEFLGERPLHTRELFLDGHILDMQDPEAFSREIYGKIHTDLKWKGIQKKYIARDFLFQLMLQAAAEAVRENAREVDVRFSYPTAYSDGDLEYFRSVWREIADKVEKATGVPMTLNEKIDCRESLAAARFFMHPETPSRLDVGEGGLSIDIGGGTSDYAFFRDRNLVGHTSILFAGRDIFLAPLRRRHGVLHRIADFRDKPSIQALDSFVNGDEERFNAYLDAVITRYGADYKKELGNTYEDPMVAEFLDIVATGLAGVLFFGGMMVSLLLKRYRDRGQQVTLPSSLRVHIGGNGCRTFDWLFRGSDRFVEYDNNYLRIVNAFKKPLLSPNQEVKLVKSSEPKAEVAFGLLADEQEIGLTGTRQVEFAGEFHRVVDSETPDRSWDVALTTADAETGKLRINRELRVFRSFLAAINVPIDKDTLNDLGISVDNRVNALRKQIADAREARAFGGGTGGSAQAAQQVKLEKDVFGDPFPDLQQPAADPAPSSGDKLLRSEPLFIMTLKQYLDDRIAAWANKDDGKH